MQRAFDLGINHFDLANNYGPRQVLLNLMSGRFYVMILPVYVMN